MKKFSAGILVYRIKDRQPEVLLVHPGGPFWAKKDLGAWSIPKGEYYEDEEPLAAAKREFEEEIGQAAPEGEFVELGEFKRKDGKTIAAWAVEADMDVSKVQSNTFEMEWPPRSGQKQEFPEIDKAAWFPLNEAAPKMHSGQPLFLEQLANILHVPFGTEETPKEPSQQQLL
jgi:predicted NUDIX family NTP pyrophosphohydrolase